MESKVFFFFFVAQIASKIWLSTYDAKEMGTFQNSFWKSVADGQNMAKLFSWTEPRCEHLTTIS